MKPNKFPLSSQSSRIQIYGPFMNTFVPVYRAPVKLMWAKTLYGQDKGIARTCGNDTLL